MGKHGKNRKDEKKSGKQAKTFVPSNPNASADKNRPEIQLKASGRGVKFVTPEFEMFIGGKESFLIAHEIFASESLNINDLANRIKKLKCTNATKLKDTYLTKLFTEDQMTNPEFDLKSYNEDDLLHLAELEGDLITQDLFDQYLCDDIPPDEEEESEYEDDEPNTLRASDLYSDEEPEFEESEGIETSQTAPRLDSTVIEKSTIDSTQIVTQGELLQLHSLYMTELGALRKGILKDFTKVVQHIVSEFDSVKAELKQLAKHVEKDRQTSSSLIARINVLNDKMDNISNFVNPPSHHAKVTPVIQVVKTRDPTQTEINNAAKIVRALKKRYPTLEDDKLEQLLDVFCDNDASKVQSNLASLGIVVGPLDAKTIADADIGTVEGCKEVLGSLKEATVKPPVNQMDDTHSKPITTKKSRGKVTAAMKFL